MRPTKKERRNQMSTRGVHGMILNGKKITTYNHGDSYAVGLGNNILNFIQNHSVAELRTLAKNMKMVKHDYRLTEAERNRGLEIDLTRLKKDKDILLNGNTTDVDVYKSIWNEAILARDLGRFSYDVEPLWELRIMEYMSADLKDVFHEWIYLIDLDAERLKIWTSWTKEYKNRKDKDDTTRTLVLDLPLTALPKTFGLLMTGSPIDGDALKRFNYLR
jgi:hypothetical protein